MSYSQEEWEVINDDGFVYKRKKRDRPDPSNSEKSSNQEKKTNLQKRKKALLRVKEKYQAEISHWEILSNTLNALNEKNKNNNNEKNEELENEEMGIVIERDLVHKRRIDELEIKVKADEDIIQSMSNLCDIAEGICNAREQRLKEEYFSLPIWAPPIKMIDVLCGTHSEADNGEQDCRSG